MNSMMSSLNLHARKIKINHKGAKDTKNEEELTLRI